MEENKATPRTKKPEVAPQKPLTNLDEIDDPEEKEMIEANCRAYDAMDRKEERI